MPTFDDAEDAVDSIDTSPVLWHVAKRWARTLAVVGASVWVGYHGIGNQIEYSEGQRVGVINKVSEKGLIWKTKEGQLSLEGRASTGDYVGAGVWDFSINRTASRGEDVEGLYSDLKKFMEEGKRVRISYKQDGAVWPWEAKTTYLIQSVEALE